jgi:hypothetical protein
MKTFLKKSASRIHEEVEEEDKRRLMRLKEAKDNKDIKKVVEMWSEEKLRPKILSDKQRTVIYLMTDFIHNFSNNYICERVQISKEELYKWRNDPMFLKELDKEITRRRSFIRIHAFRNVHRAILRGDMKSTWNYLKMSGDLKENINITDNTGEQELSDGELNQEILRLTKQLAAFEQPQEN